MYRWGQETQKGTLAQNTFLTPLHNEAFPDPQGPLCFTVYPVVA